MFNNLFNNVYADKKILITGNTGFKGSWLTLWLLNLKAKVYGLSIDIPTNPALFEILGLESQIDQYYFDINDLALMKSLVKKIKPDFIFHLAAQPIVASSYINPVDTFKTNIMGSINLMEALRLSNHICSVILVTSDKCYENQEWVWSYRESDPIGGKDPYSASKGACEVVIHSYFHSYFNTDPSNIRLVTVRAGNVIGGGDWAEKRLIPDCIKAWTNGDSVEIRNPEATRPWQHVLEPLSGYLRVGQLLYFDHSLNGESFNFGPPTDEAHSVLEMLNLLKTQWKRLDAKFTINKSSGFNEAGLLKLNCDKALAKLYWKPVLDYITTTQLTANWYQTYYEIKEDMYQFSFDQLSSYINMAKDRKLSWTMSVSKQ